MTPVADKLDDGRRACSRRRSTAASYQPAQLANGAVELLNEVSKSKITGEEERYSHTRPGRLRGQRRRRQQAVRAAAPALRPPDPTLARTIDAALRRRRRGARALPARRDASSTTRPSTPAQRRKLSQAVDALAEPLSQVGGEDRQRADGAERGRAAARRPCAARRASPRQRIAGREVGSSSLGRGGRSPRRATSSRSTARTRPGSPRRPRTACTSPPSTSSRRRRARAVQRPAARLDGRGRAHDRGRAGRAGRRPAPCCRPTDTGEAIGPRPGAADRHLRLRPVAVRPTGSASASARPAALRRSRRCPGDELDPERSRRRPRACRPARTTRRSRSTPSATSRASGAAPWSMRWSQLGFGRTSTHRADAQATPRNLMGFKDGTNNLKAEDAAALSRPRVGRRARAPAWMRGGTLPGHAPHPHAASRSGTAPSLGDQEQTIGRDEGSGRAARRRARARHGRPRGATRRRPGHPVDAHIRLAAPDDQRRRAHPAPRLLVHRRHRPASSASSTPACSSSPTSATRSGSSSPCSAGSGRTTRSTSTSSTRRAAPCSRCRPASARAGLDRAGVVRGADLRTLRRSRGT